ncbi:MAG: DUF4097 family beta strand repeat-containing protein [Acidobacteriota bacterium]
MRAREVVFVLFVIAVGLCIRAGTGLKEDLKDFHGWQIHYSDKAHEYVETKEEAVDVKAPIRFDNSHGDATITGWDQPRVSIKLTKRVYLDDEKRAKEEAAKAHILLESRAGETVIGCDRGESQSYRIETDFDITLPNSMVIKARNEHGDLSLHDLKPAALEVTANYGECMLKNVAGDVTIRADHGEPTIENLTGNLYVENTYGELQITQVSGDVKAKNTHEDTQVQKVGGGLELDSDYGDIVVREIVKDAVVRGDHSAVDLSGCEGNVTVVNSYEDVLVGKVAGKLEIHGDHSPVDFSGIGGAARVVTSYERINGQDLAGAVEIQAERAPVDLAGVAGGCTVRTSYEDVSIRDFTGRVDVSVPHSGCRLRTNTPPSAPIVVRADNGDIRLVLPPESQFQLLAESLTGEVNCRYPGMSTYRDEQKQLTRVTGSSGGGARGPMIELYCKYGDVTVAQTTESDEQAETRGRGDTKTRGR